MKKNKLIRMVTVPMSLKYLLAGQVKFMSTNGLDVKMISAAGKEVEDLISEEGALHITVPMTRAITPMQDLKCLLQLIRIFRNKQPDIVHTHTPKAGLLGMLAAKITKVPIRMHTIAGLPFMTASGIKRKLLIFIEKTTYWSADTVLPNSQSIFDFVLANRLVEKEKLSMIGYGSSNGIDLGHFSKEYVNKEKLEEIKREIRYESENKYFLAVGRIVADKGIEELVTAFLYLGSFEKNVKLILVGKIEDVRKEENLSSKVLGAIRQNENIIHVNWTDHVREYMHLSDVLIHASYREGFPNVVLQAGAMELPIICSEIPGNIDIVTNEKTGIYFEVRNHLELGERISEVLANPIKAKMQAKELRKEIEKKYSREYIHMELLKLYRDKLQDNG